MPEKEMEADVVFRNRIVSDPAEYEAPSHMWQAVSEIRDGFFLKQIYRSESGDMLWRCVRQKDGEVLLAYRMDCSRSCVELLADHSGSGGQMAFEYLAYLFPVCALQKGILTFHGALVEHHGKGMIISADSGVGKSTHARLWRDTRRALILNGDRASVRKTADGWTGYGLPWSGTSGEQINRSVPIRIFVRLERGRENRIRRMTQDEALTVLLAQLQFPAWDRTYAEEALELLDDFMREVPMYSLACRPDPESVCVLEHILEEV